MKIPKKINRYCPYCKKKQNKRLSNRAQEKHLL